jgi:hypothetical protein
MASRLREGVRSLQPENELSDGFLSRSIDTTMAQRDNGSARNPANVSCDELQGFFFVKPMPADSILP